MEQSENKKKGFLSRSVGKPWFVLLFIVLTFGLGVAFGSGRIDLSTSSSQYESNSGNLPADLDYSEVEKVYDILRENYDGKLTEEQLLTGMKKGLAEATGDPYTEFFSAEKAQEFQESINNEFSGIGAELGKDEDDNLIIVAPISGFPAEKAGLKPQDIITTINGETSRNMSIDDAVSKIRGEKGTNVELEIIRDKKEALDFTITRADIKIKSVEWEKLDGNIGLITISNFSNDTTSLVEQAAAEFKRDNVEGIVLDLRNNPGGLLDAAVEVSEQWLPAGKKILEEKRGSVVIDSFTSEGPGTLAGIPTVVLINEGSASASEIVAGALKDNDAARLIGEKTYGKGVVQQPICIEGSSFNGGCAGDLLKVTVASWYRPNGDNIDKEGIKPDQKVEITDEDIDAQKDTQTEAAVEYLKSR